MKSLDVASGRMPNVNGMKASFEGVKAATRVTSIVPLRRGISRYHELPIAASRVGRWPRESRRAGPGGALIEPAAIRHDRAGRDHDGPRVLDVVLAELAGGNRAALDVEGPGIVERDLEVERAGIRRHEQRAVVVEDIGDITGRGGTVVLNAHVPREGPARAGLVVDRSAIADDVARPGDRRRPEIVQGAAIEVRRPRW